MSPAISARSAESTEEEAVKALELGLRDYARKTGFDKVLLGLSGGIDSALTAAIAARALGPDKVLGVAMPTRYSSEGSVADAEALVANLGIDYRVIPIDGIFQSYLDGLARSSRDSRRMSPRRTSRRGFAAACSWPCRTSSGGCC